MRPGKYTLGYLLPSSGLHQRETDTNGDAPFVQYARTARWARRKKSNQTHRSRHLEAKEPQAEYEADDNTDACCKILGDVVCVVDTEACQQAPDSLENDGRPDNGIITLTVQSSAFPFRSSASVSLAHGSRLCPLLPHETQ